MGFFGTTFGESPASGVSFPIFADLARAHGLPFVKLDMKNFAPTLREALAMPGPVLCEVMLDPDQGFEPRQSSRQLPDGRIVSAPLEDMFPFLEREEMMENLLIAPWED
jgi:acetolactate synthase-1/2/3 large subunit